MTIEYQVVWVDDTPDWVNSIIEEVKDHITEAGFTPNISVIENGDDLEKICAEEDLDLLIVDFNLPEKKGDELIADLRHHGVFKEAVFYSQDPDANHQLVSTDNVFVTDRDEAVDTIKKAIDITTHKLRDLEVVRGLIIASSIDLEVEIEQIMLVAFRDHADLFQTKVLGKEGVYDFAKKYMFVQSYLNDVAKTFEDDDKDRLKEAVKFLKTFMDDVVKPRNILAHVRRTLEGDKVILKGLGKKKNDIDFDQAWLRDRRVKFREHKENLQVIQGILMSQGED